MRILRRKHSDKAKIITHPEKKWYFRTFFSQDVLHMIKQNEQFIPVSRAANDTPGGHGQGHGGFISRLRRRMQ